MKATADWQAIAHEGMLFFGNVSASISHEINNRIAVINEKAGLLQDLAAMLAKGREVDPTRLEVQSQKIIEQVRLAKQSVRNLNRFAHSVDAQHSRIEVAELLEFVVALSARHAATAETTLAISDSSAPVAITMNPFFLEALIGRAIDIALARVGDARKVVISVRATEDGCRIAFEGLAGLTDPLEVFEAKQRVPALLECLGARYRSDNDGTVLLLEIPVPEQQAHGRTE
jgi:C4-dicarboxylate-specific signal transduction histidine kinase